MGRLNTLEEKLATLEWARSYGKSRARSLPKASLSRVRPLFETELKAYFSLAALSRSTTSPKDMVRDAHAMVFRCRVALERRITQAVLEAANGAVDGWMFEGSFYGFSKKQGTSVRMPLLSCRPTSLCAGGCYAHDVLDAAPLSVIRGAVNGAIAGLFEDGDLGRRADILSRLERHSHRAIKAAKAELKSLAGSGWTRRPFIRFSHVGEITAFPQFANALAQQVRDLSQGAVDCVVYTRLQTVSELDPELWIINFTLDQSSRDRKAWVPPHARIVFSAFGGEVDPDAEVNFLEHHRWAHLSPIGQGRVCPATAPDVPERTCDAVRCNRCFERSKR